MFLFLKPKFKLEDKDKLIAYANKTSLPLMFYAENYSNFKLRRIIKHTVKVVLYIGEEKEWKELKDTYLDRLNFLLDTALKKGINVRISSKKIRIVSRMLAKRNEEIAQIKKQQESIQAPKRSLSKEIIESVLKKPVEYYIDGLQKESNKKVELNGFEIGSDYSGPENILTRLGGISGKLKIKTNDKNKINSLTWIPMKNETESLPITYHQIIAIEEGIENKFDIDFINSLSLISPNRDAGFLMDSKENIMFTIEYQQLNLGLEEIMWTNFHRHIDEAYSFKLEIIDYQEYLKS